MIMTDYGVQFIITAVMSRTKISELQNDCRNNNVLSQTSSDKIMSSDLSFFSVKNELNFYM